MADDTLRGLHVLVVEDEYMLAEDLRTSLEDAGVEIVGPVGRLQAALDAIRSAPELDAAVVDVNLGGEMAYPVADLLRERGVPFVFATGYDDSMIPPRFSGVARCEKPVDFHKVVGALERAMHA